MYPHDGHIEDIGAGKGRGYNINMHFPMDSCDSVYRYAFDELVPFIVSWTFLDTGVISVQVTALDYSVRPLHRCVIFLRD